MKTFLFSIIFLLVADCKIQYSTIGYQDDTINHLNVDQITILVEGAIRDAFSTNGRAWKYEIVSLKITWSGGPEVDNHPIVAVLIYFHGDNAGDQPNLKDEVATALTHKNRAATATFEVVDNCYDIYTLSQNKTYIQSESSFKITLSTIDVTVHCDMENGGWTLIHKHEQDITPYPSSKTQYINGFGDITTHYWLGLTYLNSITSKKAYKLRVELEDCDKNKNYIDYDDFKIGEASDFKLSLSLAKTSLRSPPGDSMYNPSVMLPANPPPAATADPFSQLGMSFSTNDGLAGKNGENGGWWFNSVSKNRYNMANLNGKVQTGCAQSWPNGMVWNSFTTAAKSLKWSQMKILPADPTVVNFDFVSM